MQSNREDSYNFFEEGVPEEIKLAILEQVSEFKDFTTLREVCRELNRLAGHSNLNYGFFSFFNHCQFHAGSKQYILAPDKLTAADVRAGNQLVRQAMDFCCQGDMQNGEELLKKAMYRYGSHYAMECIKCLSTLPGRRSLNFNIDMLIGHYRKQAEAVLKNEYELHFPEAKHLSCSDLRIANTDFSEKIQALNFTILELYKTDHGVSSANAPKLRLNMDVRVYERLDIRTNYGKFPYPTLKFSSFDAAGFLGIQPPKKNWYLHTQASMRQAKREEIIDCLPTVTAARQLYLK